jgi:hypothetical protein
MKFMNVDRRAVQRTGMRGTLKAEHSSAWCGRFGRRRFTSATEEQSLANHNLLDTFYNFKVPSLSNDVMEV